MPKKPSKIIVLAVFLPGFFLLNTGACDQKDLSNERPFVSGTEIESYWEIDCEKTENELTALIAELLNDDLEPSSEITREKLHRNLSDLKKCGYIYNNSQNDRFTACANYVGAAFVVETYLNDPKERAFPLTAKNFHASFFNCL